MSAQFPLGFKITSAEPIDARLVLTAADLATAHLKYAMPDTYFAVCSSDNKLYIYDKDNTIDAVTGRFRVLPTNTPISDGQTITVDVDPDNEYRYIVSIFGSAGAADKAALRKHIDEAGNISYTWDVIYDKADLDNALSNKVDKETGKCLILLSDINRLNGMANNATRVEASSTNGNIKINSTETTVYTLPADVVQDADYVHTDKNFTADLRSKLLAIEDGAQLNKVEDVKVKTDAGTASVITDKVATIDLTGKQDKIDALNKLSLEYVSETAARKFYTADEKTKLAGIETGAQVNVLTDVTVNNTSVLTDKVAKLTVETTLDNDSPNPPSTTAVRAYVTTNGSHYVTSTASNDSFATHDALVNAEHYYYAGKLYTPVNNDYAVVAEDETHEGKQARYLYLVSESVGTWTYQYSLSENFTPEQQAAIDSGIDSADVAKLADITPEATKTAVITEKAGTIEINGVTKVIIPDHTVTDADYKHITVTESSVSDGTNTLTKYDDTEIAGKVLAVENRATALEADTTALKNTVGDSTKGLVKGLADEVTRATTAESTLNTKVTNAEAALLTKVENTTTIAGINLQDNITGAELRTALNVADGAQANVLEKVKLNGTELAITDKAVNVEVDLTPYAKTTDVTTALATKQDLITTENKLDYALINNTPTIPTKTSDLVNDNNFIAPATEATTAGKVLKSVNISGTIGSDWGDVTIDRNFATKVAVGNLPVGYAITEDMTIKEILFRILCNSTLTSIDYTGTPTKTYKIGEQFDKSKIVVTAYYDDGSSYVIPEDQYTATTLNWNTTKVTLSYLGKTVDINDIVMRAGITGTLTYCTIDEATSVDTEVNVADGYLSNQVVADEHYELTSDSLTVTGECTSSITAEKKVSITEPHENISFTVTAKAIEYTPTASITNGTCTFSKSVYTVEDTTGTATIQPNARCKYPTSISISGATIVSYSSTTGVVTFNTIRGIVTITATCPEVAWYVGSVANKNKKEFIEIDSDTLLANATAKLKTDLTTTWTPANSKEIFYFITADGVVEPANGSLTSGGMVTNFTTTADFTDDGSAWRGSNAYPDFTKDGQVYHVYRYYGDVWNIGSDTMIINIQEI